MANKYYGKAKGRGTTQGYKASFCRMLPAILMVGLVPLLVRLSSHENGLTKYGWFGNGETSYELFLLPKSVLLMLLMFAMAVIIGMRLWKEKRKIAFVKLLLPLFVYGLFAFLSACFSVNRRFSFEGGYEQFESIWVLLSYVLVVYYVFLYARTETELQVVVDALCFGATFVGLIGTLQGLGHDPMSWKFVQRLITSEEFMSGGGRLEINFGNGQAYSTMYNPNYLGVFGAFVFPFLVVLLLFEKNKWRRIWHGASSVLVAVAMLSSRSRAGLIAAVAALCVALLFYVRNILKWWYLTIPAINFAVALLLLVNAYNDNVILDRLKNIFEKDAVSVVVQEEVDGVTVRKTGLTRLYTAKDEIGLTYNGADALISLHTEGNMFGVYAFDGEGNQLELTPNENGTVYTFAKPELRELGVQTFFRGEKICLKLIADREWNFIYNAEKGKYQHLTDNYGKDGLPGKESDMKMSEAIGFKNHQQFFSKRGFIWSRTIPLLMEHIFFGSGPDTYVLEYPHEDYLSAQKNGFLNQIMTKPHSMYLQIGVQTGVLSLICLLVFYFWYAVQCVRLYAFRNIKTLLEGFGVAAFIGSIGYMLSGISNDSMVVTAPVFWGMMGIGVAANVMVQKKREAARDDDLVSK